MKKEIPGRVWWLITIFYISITYATLGIMPAVWNGLNSLLKGNGLLSQYIIYSVIGISTLAYILFIKKEKFMSRYLIFFLFVIAFFIMVKFEKNPGEKIHMAQYGLLGALLYNALKTNFDRFDRRLYLYGILACLLIGAFDEIIQYFLPNRFFTWHDVFINGASGIIVLLIIRFNILKREEIITA